MQRVLFWALDRMEKGKESRIAGGYAVWIRRYFWICKHLETLIRLSAGGHNRLESAWPNITDLTVFIG